MNASENTVLIITLFCITSQYCFSINESSLILSTLIYAELQINLKVSS